MSVPLEALHPGQPWLAHDECTVCRNPRIATVSLYGGPLGLGTEECAEVTARDLHAAFDRAHTAVRTTGGS